MPLWEESKKVNDIHRSSHIQSYIHPKNEIKNVQYCSTVDRSDLWFTSIQTTGQMINDMRENVTMKLHYIWLETFRRTTNFFET